MNKSVVVIETPEFCAECPCCDECVEVCKIIDREIREVNGECQKPDWCPLKVLPKKHRCINDTDRRGMDFDNGWNACLEKLEEEK